MKKSERDELIRRMEEAVLLPAEDPARRRMYHEILEAGDWAREHWLELVQQDERLRLELRDVDPPAGLNDRLRGLPETLPVGEARRPRRGGRLISRRGWLGLAASLTAAASAGSVAWLMRNESSLDVRFEQLGDAVYAHHGLSHPVRFASSDPAEVTHHFADAFDWPVRLPTMGMAYELLGASDCELAGEPVLCTQWRGADDRRYTVFQFCPPDHGLPEGFTRRIIRAGDGQADSDVTFWTEDRCAYVMVADEKRGRSFPDSRA